MAKHEQDQFWYATVQVMGYDEGRNRGVTVVESLHKTWLDAAQQAERLGYGHEPFPFSLTGPYPPVIGEKLTFPFGEFPALDKHVHELRWQDEAIQPILVCRWDGRNGPPRPGLNVEYSSGRDYLGRAEEERRAFTHSRHDRTCTDTWYVVVEKHEGMQRAGRVISMHGAKEDAIRHSQERIAVLQDRERLLRPDALHHEAFNPQHRPKLSL